MKYFGPMAACILLTASVLPSWAARRVACIGNSITYGMRVENREQNAYPVQLGRMLGEDFEVANFGHSGATLLNKGHRPYMTLPEFKAALAFKPDIAVIHLGVNDTDPRDWPVFGDEFVHDYAALIDSLRAVNPAVEVYIARLTPIVAKHARFRSGTQQWRLEVQDAIAQVAAVTGAHLIDFDAPLRDRQNLIPDGVHPNAQGARLLAETAYKAISGKYGPLRMSPLYSDGMVLQRNRPLHIGGMADRGAKISVTLDGHSYTTRANELGEWTVVTAPIVTGPSYTLTVTDGKDRLQYKDIQAGEVWIASGQSNMAFRLGNCTDGPETVAAARDSLLRIFDMQKIANTDNIEWSDSIRGLVDELKFYRPARWQAVNPKTAKPFSAVAYHFGRVLRDSLQVPVGIICNAVGGSPCEAWVDVNTLEAEMPEVLVNWRKNDYVQPWCQERAVKNAGTDHRHPYEPSYLFSAGVRPLGAPDIAGVIWYQGESNAHNTMLWERIYPLMIDSWRRHFHNPSLPFYSVQLSSMNRPSWPLFRDAQRRVDASLDNVYTAMSFDFGHETDVHPRNKRPVGERLARQALYHSYNFTNIVPGGPEFVSAHATDGKINLKVRNGRGLNNAVGFEIAEHDGDFRPAQAVILNDSTITLSNMDIKKPRYFRYAWKPFVDQHMRNEEGIPASTTKMEIDNAADYDIEAGMECGVSAPYAGRVDGRIIVAGGCNFPVDPMAPGSQKKFYSGIYEFNPASEQWSRVGTLPQGMAYGVAVPWGKNMLIIGGTSATQSLNKLYLLSANGSQVTVDELPYSLPKAMDNMAAAVLDNVVYLAGGNLDGTPSRELWALDLNNTDKGWKKLRSLPGNPRVQPVMAATNGCLYLWGGFAGKHKGHDASLETAGLCYNPAKNKWTSLPAPRDAQGNDLSLGGGAATVLSDGRITATGGVNKDVFLAALQNQAADYLQHPIEWYRFNPNILVFEPATQTWSVADSTADAARAGAAIVPGADSDFYLFGGELKPRIRTAQTLHTKL